MPFSLTDGVNEREPTLLSDGAMQDCEGAEYRVGQVGVFVARGRDQVGDLETASVAPEPLAPGPDSGNYDPVTTPNGHTEPLIWFRADDILGATNDSDRNSVPQKSSRISISSWTDGPNTGSRPVRFFSSAGSENMAGHACIQNKATGTDLSLNGLIQNGDPGWNTDVEFPALSPFTVMFIYGFASGGAASSTIHHIIGAQGGAERSSVSAPISNASSTPWMTTNDAGSATATDIGTYSDPTDGIRVGIYRRTGTTVTYFGNNTTTGSSVSVTKSHADLGDYIEFDSLFNDSTIDCPTGVKLAELAIWDEYLPDSTVESLFQWAAQRFASTGLSELEGATVQTVGLYEAGFDASAGFLIAHEGNSLHAAPVAAGLSFSLIDNLPSGSSAIVGCHYANRHYIASAQANRRLEQSGEGVTSFPIGMSSTTFVVGASVTQGAGDMTATIGLEYWVTEYDSARGIESIFGTTANTGDFASLDSVIVTATGVSANPRADQIRWYRSADGGGYPDGGLIQTTAIGTTQITDTNIATSSLTVPQYGIISIGGLDSDRDEPPPAMSTIFGPFQDSLMGFSVAEPRVMRFTPAGYPDSWPSAYGVPLETHRRDEGVTGVVLPGRIGVFCRDSVHVIYRLPRDADSVFAAGEAQEMLTDERGCMSRRGACTFTPPGGSAIAAWVARDGIWASNLAITPFPLTDGIDWEARVSIVNLHLCRLVNDPLNRRLVFIHRRADDTTHNTGVWYIDYQREDGLRITFADHGPLVDAVTVGSPDGLRHLYSADSRAGDGQLYLESAQDVDDSQLRDASGSVRFRIRTKEFMPAGPRGTLTLGKATWMHDAGPDTVEHRFYHNRRDNNPEVKLLPDPDSRNASDVVLQRSVNSFSLELSSVGTASYGVHWVDVEGFDPGSLGGRKGA